MSKGKLDLIKRVTCPECGATVIKFNTDGPYAICPDGHGRLIKIATLELKHVAIMKSLPEATKVKGGKFMIDGRDGTFCFKGGSGKRPPEPEIMSSALWVIAYLYNGRSIRVRAFCKVAEG